jgi:hypothetical protein
MVLHQAQVLARRVLDDGHNVHRVRRMGGQDECIGVLQVRH